MKYSCISSSDVFQVHHCEPLPVSKMKGHRYNKEMISMVPRKHCCARLRLIFCGKFCNRSSKTLGKSLVEIERIHILGYCILNMLMYIFPWKDNQPKINISRGYFCCLLNSLWTGPGYWNVSLKHPIADNKTPRR